ncbi:MAG: hypothetical protein R3C29_03240 [Dehalococcoidia bacterium]
MASDEHVTTILTVRDYERDYLLLATRNGIIKRTPLPGSRKSVAMASCHATGRR